MRRSIWLFLGILIVTSSMFVCASNLYALGHGGTDPNRIHGSTADCSVCHDFYGYYQNTGYNWRFLKETIEWPTGTFHTVVYTGLTGTNSLADGDGTYDGPCEVCHTSTVHHQNDGSDGTEHYDGEYCTACHPHFLDDITDYFEVRFVGGQSHETHLADYDDPKGPYIDDCTYCHLGSTDYSIFADNEPLATTTVCDECHSDGGTYDGVGEYDPNDTPEDDTWETAHPNSVAYGAKYNWINGIYNEEKGDSLKEGKKKWCVGCHDNDPSVIDTVVQAVQAPKVGGDGTSLRGYWFSGHGRASNSYPNGLTCGGTDPENAILACHNIQGRHNDGNDKTYEVNETVVPPVVVNTYADGYRLAGRLDVPRLTGDLVNPGEYQLCTQCHSDVFGISSNFRFDKTLDDPDYLHADHANIVYPQLTWDSDNDRVSTTFGGRADSAMTCPTCHNVHGTRMRLGASTWDVNKVMIRDGWLNWPAENGLDFRWYDDINGYQGDGSFTSDLWDSLSGEMWCADSNNDPSCSWQPCHDDLPYYNRDPRGAADIMIDALWFTDLSNNVKTVFLPGDDVRIHVDFRVVGSESYFVKSVKNSSYIRQQGLGSFWSKKIKPNRSATLPAAAYVNYWTWDKQIPADRAVPGPVNAVLVIRLFDFEGGTLLASDKKETTFQIGP